MNDLPDKMFFSPVNGGFQYNHIPSLAAGITTFFMVPVYYFSPQCVVLVQWAIFLILYGGWYVFYGLHFSKVRIKSSGHSLQCSTLTGSCPSARAHYGQGTVLRTARRIQCIRLCVLTGPGAHAHHCILHHCTRVIQRFSRVALP